MDSETLENELAGHERPNPAFLEDPPKQLLIDGKWVEAASGATLETIDPTTEEVLTTFAAGDKADVDAAVVGARRALGQPSWSGMNPHERTRLLLRIADLIEAHADEFIMIEALDSGTPTSVAGYMSRSPSTPSATTLAGRPSCTAKRPRPIPAASATRVASRSASVARSRLGTRRSTWRPGSSRRCSPSATS
jgi:hypothetical protein